MSRNSAGSASSGKKICFIASVFAPYNKGGAETVINNIVNGFKKTNHQIFIITICPFKNIKNLLPQKSIEGDITIYRFYPLNFFSFLNINKYKNQTLLRLIWHGLDMFNLHSYFIVRRILAREKPDVVMTHALKGISYLIPRAIKSQGIKNIHTLHDVQLSTPSGLILKGEESSWQHTCWLTKMYQSFNRWLFATPDIIISSSKFLLDFYTSRGFFPKAQKIILTNPIVYKTEKQQSVPVTTNEFNFLFLGQIEKYKGILLLIKVFNQLKKSTVNLLIVGTGSALAEAQQLAKNNPHIKFLGYVPNKELSKIFSQTHATIVSSLCYENSPTVIFESLSHGVPVIAARIGGIEFVKDDYNGFTFEAGDEADLLRILKFSLQNKKQLDNMRTNCLESVKDIGIKKYIEKIEKLI